MYLTNDGSDLGTKNIILNGTYGHGYFAGTVSWDTVKANTVCLNNDPTTPCRITWPTGGTVVAGWESIWSTWAWGIAYYNSWLVGIGTNTPGYRLDVHGSIRANGSLLVTWWFLGWMYRWDSNIWGNYPYMNFMFGSLFLVGWSGAWGHNIYIVPNAADSSKGMVMTTGWNVGINTNTPVSQLQIDWSTWYIGLGNIPITGGDMSYMFLNSDKSKPIGWLRMWDYSLGSLIWNVFDSVALFAWSWSSAAIITLNATTWYVGIGTTTPESLLHVAGTAQFGNNLFGYSTTYDWILQSPAAANLKFNTNGANTRMIINASWYVGINTLSPTEKLHVVGNGKVSGSMQVWYEQWRCSTLADAGKIVYFVACGGVTVWHYTPTFLWCIGSWTTAVIPKIFLTWATYDWGPCINNAEGLPDWVGGVLHWEI